MIEDNELIRLIKKAQQGDQKAKSYILEQNLNLVRSILHRFANRGFEWDDLFQTGCIGLMKAVERFDDEYKVKFSTYAVPMIIGEIRRYMRDTGPLKVSRSLKELAYRIHRTQERLQGDLGREPTITEIARELMLAPQEIVAALEAVQAPASLFDKAFHDENDNISLLDQIAGNSQEVLSIDNLALQEMISRLPPKERTVIVLRFFEDKTQAEVAGLIGVSQVQVSRIEKHALKLIKEEMLASS